MSIIPEQWVVSEWYHCLDNPKNGSVVSKQVFSQRNKLNCGTFNQETLDVLVKPRLVPQRHVIHLSLFLGVFHVGEIADHNDRFIFTENSGFDEIRRLRRHLKNETVHDSIHKTC